MGGVCSQKKPIDERFLEVMINRRLGKENYKLQLQVFILKLSVVRGTEEKYQDRIVKDVNIFDKVKRKERKVKRTSNTSSLAESKMETA